MPDRGSRVSRQLDAVYGATSAAEIAQTYDDWAEGYDAEMAALGYRHPAICLALLARHLPASAGPVLDAGAGTGLLGQWLRLLGYGPLEAVDLSSGMLRVAERKGVYDRLEQGDLTARLPFDNRAFRWRGLRRGLHGRPCRRRGPARAPARAAARAACWC